MDYQRTWVLIKTDFLENPDSTKPSLPDEKPGEYLLNVETKVPYGEIKTFCFSGDRERYLGLVRKILAVLEPGPSEQILESLGRIEKLLGKENQKT